jgi:AcrR family transcriptional regulator
MPKVGEKLRAARRQGLIDAGWRCLAHTGYRDLTVDQVCREAAVSKGSFYGYFSHKQSLLLALLEDDSASLKAAMIELEAREPDPSRRLRAFAAHMLARAESPQHVQMMADLWAAMLTDPNVRATLRRSIADRRRILRSWVEDGIASQRITPTPANALASLMLALGEGLTLHAGLDDTGFRWENIRLTVDLLLAALAPS